LRGLPLTATNDVFRVRFVFGVRFFVNHLLLSPLETVVLTVV